MMIRRIIVWGMITSGLLLMAAGCQGSHTSSDQPSSTSNSQATANQAAASSLLTAKGVVESRQDIDISSRVAGTITAVHVDEGQTTRQGDVLVTLDDNKIKAKTQLEQAELDQAKAHDMALRTGSISDQKRAQSEVNRAKAIRDQAMKDYAREKNLYDNQASTLVELQRAEVHLNVTQNQLSQAEADFEKVSNGTRKEEIAEADALVKKAAAALNYDRTMLKDYTLLSPFDGLVVQKMKNSGETVDVAIPILKLINPKNLRVRAELQELDVGKAKEGDSVQVFDEADKGWQHPHNGKVYKVVSVLRRKSLRSFDPLQSYDMNVQNFYVRLDDLTGLKSGMTVTVRFLQ